MAESMVQFEWDIIKAETNLKDLRNMQKIKSRI